MSRQTEQNMDYKEASRVKLEVGSTSEALERALRISSTTVPAGNQDFSDHFFDNGVALWARTRRDQEESIIPLRNSGTGGRCRPRTRSRSPRTPGTRTRSRRCQVRKIHARSTSTAARRQSGQRNSPAVPGLEASSILRKPARHSGHMTSSFFMDPHYVR